MSRKLVTSYPELAYVLYDIEAQVPVFYTVTTVSKARFYSDVFNPL